LWPKYKDNAKFMMLVLGREHSDADLEKYNQKKGFTFPLYPDPERGVFSKFADQTIPRTYLYGKDGKLIYSATGYSPDEFEKLMQAIEGALK
jgi:thioredoxin-related protein